MQQALATLRGLVAELERRRSADRSSEVALARHIDYYKGKAGKLRFASDTFAEHFQRRFAGFSDNWCQPVAQAPAERMEFHGVRLADAPANAEPDAESSRVWRENNAERGASEAFVLAIAASRAFGLVWGDPADEQTPRVTFEHPMSAIVGYDPDSGRRVSGLKLWADDLREYATLYLPDGVWKFQRFRPDTGASRLYVPGGERDGWEPRQPASDDVWPLPNPMGVVPLVELRNQTLLDDVPISDIAGVEAMQDAINLLWAYLFNALDFASLPQRVVLGADMPKVPVLDENGQVVGEKPYDIQRLMRDRVFWLEGKEAKIDEWTPATLDVYSDVVEKGVEHIAAQTRTPPHYLIGKMVNTAAEALTVAETGLVAKTRERQTYFGATMREMHRLIALAQGDEAKARAIRGGVPLWADPQYRSEAQKADALLKLTQIGFPFQWVAERYGLSPDEVGRVVAMRQEQADSDLTRELSKLLSPTPQPVEE